MLKREGQVRNKKGRLTQLLLFLELLSLEVLDPQLSLPLVEHLRPWPVVEPQVEYPSPSSVLDQLELPYAQPDSIEFALEQLVKLNSLSSTDHGSIPHSRQC